MLLLLPIAVSTQTDHSPPQTGMAVWARMAIKSPYAVWPARLDPYAPILPVWARPIPCQTTSQPCRLEVKCDPKHRRFSCRNSGATAIAAALGHGAPKEMSSAHPKQMQKRVRMKQAPCSFLEYDSCDLGHFKHYHTYKLHYIIVLTYNAQSHFFRTFCFKFPRAR
jgi:hypothetical protein